MKGMADTLRGLGELVANRTLVLNVLQGLNSKYDCMNTYLKRTLHFPSFHDVHNDLLLEDITLGAEAASDGLQQRHPPPLPWPPLLPSGRGWERGARAAKGGGGGRGSILLGGSRRWSLLLSTGGYEGGT
jgi:hypothetical protein